MIALVTLECSLSARKIRERTNRIGCFISKFMDDSTYNMKLLQLKCINESITDISRSETCVDPTDAIKKKHLVKLKYLFNDGSRLLDLPAIRKIFRNITIANETLDLTESLAYGDTLCNLKMTSESMTRGLCPWHYVAKYRLNRYPRLQLYAKCNCNNCHHMPNKTQDDFSFGCRPIIKLSPALVRGECINGTYDWKPILEYTSIGCICARNDRNKPIA